MTVKNLCMTMEADKLKFGGLVFCPQMSKKNLIYVEDAGKIRAVSIYVIRKVPGEQGRIWVLPTGLPGKEMACPANRIWSPCRQTVFSD